MRLVNYMDVYKHNFIGRSLDLMPVTATDSEKLRFQVRKSDILFTPSSETPDDIGHAAVVVDDLPNTLHSYHTVRLRLDHPMPLDLRFSGWFGHANQLRSHFAKRATGSTRYTLTLGDFAAAPLCLPPLPEQRQIAETLDTLDEAIRKTEAIIEKLKQVKQGMLHDLLTRGIDHNGELRDPERHPEQFKDSPLGRIPKEWEVAQAREICSLITKGTTPPARAFSTDERSVRYLRVDNLTFSGALDLSLPPLYIDSSTHRSALARSIVREGDVLMNIVGPPLGKISLVPPATHEWNINQAIVVYRLRSRVSAPFLTRWLLSQQVKSWFRRESKQTSGQVNLTLEMCGNLPVAIPSPAEQTRLLGVLQTFDERLEREWATLSKQSDLKQGLMEDLLTGRVRVTSLLQEAAE